MKTNSQKTKLDILKSFLKKLEPLTIIIFSIIVTGVFFVFKEGYYFMSIVYFLLALFMWASFKYKNFKIFLLIYFILFLIAILGYTIYTKKINLTLIEMFLTNLLFLIVPTFLFIYSLKFNSFKKTFSIFIYYSLLIAVILIFLTQTKFFSEEINKTVNLIDSQIDYYFKMIKKGGVSETFIREKIIRMEWWKEILKNYLPASVFIFLMLYFTLNYGFYTLALSFHQKKALFLRLIFLKVNFYVIWLFIICWAILFALLNIKIDFNFLKLVFWNLSIIISFIYYLQGLSILIMFMLILRIPFIIKFGITLLFFYFSLLSKLWLPVAIVVTGIGIMEVWINIKKYAPEGESE